MTGINHYLVLSLILFSIGMFGVLTRRSAIGILLSLELMLNAVNINLVAFSHFLESITGHIFAIFLIAVAAAESCVGLAIIICVYRTFKDIRADNINLLKW